MGIRRFRVEGMTCASCVRRVEKALAGVPGVAAVQVNLATEEAAVEGPALDLEVLGGALAARGYRLVAAPEPDAHKVNVRHAGLRAAAAWILTLPLMAGMVPGLHLHLAWPVQAVLAGLAAFGAGWGFVRRAARQAWGGETSMDTLIALGAAVTWGFGVHEGLRGARHLPFEAAAGLVAFLLTGKWLEAKAKHRAGDSLETLLALAPATAVRLGPDGAEEPVPTRELRAGGPGAGQARHRGAGGRRGAGGPGRGGGGAAHRRAPARGQGPGRPGDRRGAGARGRPGDAGRRHRPGHLAGPAGPAGGPRPRVPGPRSRTWPTGCRRCSCRPSWCWPWPPWPAGGGTPAPSWRPGARP